jgi:hypothetical protein
MKEQIEAYVLRVRDLSEHCRGNEQATKQSLIGPLFTMLGYDLTDPRECRPEYRADFGKERSVKPVDWAFMREGRPTFYVEAKEVGRKLAGYDEQLADYFAKSPETKLGILSNGVSWRFFTDLENANVMDKEPFVRWDVLNEEPPYDFLTLLQKSQYNSELVRTFATRRRNQNLLIAELNRLLEPSTEFTKLAIANLETRSLMPHVVESWRPVVAGALGEWVKQRMLSSVLAGPRPPEEPVTPAGGSKGTVETTAEELEAFALVQRLLGPSRPVGYQDTASYFKIHLPERHTWVVARLLLERKRPVVWIPLVEDEAAPLAGGFGVSTPEAGWTAVTLGSATDVGALGDLLRTAWDVKRKERPAGLA